MSVPASKRSLSDFEFYNTAFRLRKVVTQWLLRDFGAKPRYRDPNFLEVKYKMADEDKKSFENLLAKYNCGGSICDEYPQWWINERRTKIDSLLTELLENIVKAFNLYATTLAEFDERRIFQDRAIASVYALLEECQFVINTLYRTGGIDVDRYEPLVRCCNDEIALLKGWRKKGNAQRKGIIKHEQALRKKIDPTAQTQSGQEDAI